MGQISQYDREEAYMAGADAYMVGGELWRRVCEVYFHYINITLIEDEIS